MQYTLKNDFLSVGIHSKGAELCKLTDSDGLNYLWSGDATYWPRHAPILFPLVGRVADGTYTYSDKTYAIGQHGFARDSVFKLTKESPTSLTFTLHSTAETHTLYPFDFILNVIYTLHQQTLSIVYEVLNPSDETIVFKLGAHPGFMCPLFEGELMEDYYLTFENPEKALMMTLTPEGLFTSKTTPFIGQTIPLSPECFAKDALVFTNLSSRSISLCSHKHNKKLSVGFENFPFLGIWSPAHRSPFVCIEPWFGHADFIDDSKDLTKKSDLVHLSSHQTFNCTHTITIH